MDKEILEEMLKNKLSIREISLKVNKSKTSIQYWIKKYNLKPTYDRRLINNVIKCEFCDLETNNKLSFKSHEESCKRVIDNLDEIINSYESGESFAKIVSNYKISRHLLKRILIKMNIKIRDFTAANKLKNELGKNKHDDKSKNKISTGRKKYLNENKNKHNWVNNKISKPCENFKEVIKKMGINYIEEMRVSNERKFRADISLPEYGIIFEINGNQHYEKDGTLNKYYQERHDYIENLGWRVIEIHYSECFDNDKMESIIKNSIENKEIHDFDYEKYISDKLSKSNRSNLCECGNYKPYKSKKCKLCK